MRFGIMAMQLGALAPAGGGPQEMMAHVATFDHAALVRNLYEQHFDPVELGGDLVLFMPHTYSPAAVEGLAALKAERLAQPKKEAPMPPMGGGGMGGMEGMY